MKNGSDEHLRMIAELRDSIAQARHFLDFLEVLYMKMPSSEEADKLAQWAKIADGMLNTDIPSLGRPKVWKGLSDQVWDDLSCVVEEWHEAGAERFPDYLSTIMALDALGSPA